MKKSIFVLLAFGTLTIVSAFSLSDPKSKSAKTPKELNSFQQVKDFTYKDPHWTYDPNANEQMELPHRIGVQVKDLIELVVYDYKNKFFGKKMDRSNKWEFAIRSRELLTNSANFKEDYTPKWLHPRGVCASAEWIIEEDTEATGLFAKGTKVPAIMRISSGTHESERLDDEGQALDRLYGMAVKLFHSQDPNKVVKSSNILTLDKYGFGRSNRPYILQPAVSDDLYFTNVAPTDDPLGKILSKALDMFDNPNWARPMYVSGHFDQEDKYVSRAVTPYEVRFIPRFKRPERNYDDFRYELLDTNIENGHFDIVIEKMYEHSGSISKKIGRLVLTDKLVITDNCDLRLAFHHSPNEWKKHYEKGYIDPPKSGWKKFLENF